MKVLMDLSTLNQERVSGVGVLMKNLFENIDQDFQQQGDILVPVVKPSRWKCRNTVKGHIGKTPEVYWPWFSDKPDIIFHGPDCKIPSFKKAKTVVSIHDLAFFEEGMTSKGFAKQRIDLFHYTMKNQKPTAVMTISESTKRDIVKYYPEYEDRIHVVYLGCDHIHAGDQGSAAISADQRPFFLFVGNLEARKNVVGLLKAFDIFASKNPDVDLVLVGKPGFEFEAIEEQIKSMQSVSQVIQPGYVSNDQLARYYSQALGFVYPSYYEGFGIPIIESMIKGCPVITADATSTGEISGNAALLCAPDDHDAIAFQMQRLLDDEELRKDLVAKGKAQAKQFTWARAAKESRGVYESL